MGVRVLTDDHLAVIYDSTAGVAFGPVVSETEHGLSASDVADRFLAWLDDDARHYTPADLAKLYGIFRRRVDLDLVELVAEVRKLAAEKPDRTGVPVSLDPRRHLPKLMAGEPGCSYMGADERIFDPRGAAIPYMVPACIFGEALTRLGIELDWDWEGKGIGAVLRDLTDPDDDDDEPRFDAFDRIQQDQDLGTPWGELDLEGLADEVRRNR